MRSGRPAWAGRSVVAGVASRSGRPSRAGVTAEASRADGASQVGVLDGHHVRGCFDEDRHAVQAVLQNRMHAGVGGAVALKRTLASGADRAGRRG